jgi:hypothetical protein
MGGVGANFSAALKSGANAATARDSAKNEVAWNMGERISQSMERCLVSGAE